jgi:putative membrane protein
MMRSRIAALILLSQPVLMAHAGEPLKPHDLWSAWEFEPGVVLPLLITAILYSRGARISRGVTPSEVISFWAGWTTLALSLVSPLHSLGGVLFSAHMAQHEILMLVSAPLLALSRPLVPLLWGMPEQYRRRLGAWSKREVIQTVWQTVTRPWVAWWVHAAAIWLWHIPAWFQATLSSEWVHTAQHLSFLGSALLFWWSLLFARDRTGYGLGMLYIFTTGVHTSILGALIALTNSVWYPVYRETRNWGLTALEDQQLGGLIMWIPASVVYLGAGLAMLLLWLRESDLMAGRSGYAQ